MLKKFLETKINIKLVGLLAIMAVFGFTTANAQTRNDLQSKLGDIQKKITSYQQQIAKTRQQQASLNNEISIYDNQIASLELQIQANATQKEDVSLQIEELQIQIDRRKAEIDENKKLLAELVKQMAEMDENSFLQMGLGTDDFSSFLDQFQYTRSVQEQVYSLVSRIKEIKSKLELQQQDLKAQLNKLEELKEQLEITQESLDSQKTAKEGLLQQTKGIEKNYQSLLSKSKGEEDKLQEEIYELDAAARRKAGNTSISPKKGVLAWPMNGTLTQGYGNTGFTSLGYNFHNGIDVAAPAGQPIYSPADGTVAHCDTGQAAYGNWCTIRHTVDTSSGKRNIVTLFAHMRSVKIRAGQIVKGGDLIGYEGNTGNTTRLIYGPERGYHLHFTVFDANGYTVTNGKNTAVYGAYSVPSGVTYNPMNFLGK
jgi:murein DD-endopeptidase MepM/ murein hydrolase activator NlpD